MRDAVRDLQELRQLLGLSSASANVAKIADQGFPLLVPRGYVARMRSGDPLDPLLLQVLPRSVESNPSSGFTEDPVGDAAATRSPGLLQKYTGRALLITTGACAVHCRYCFRRNYPYEDSPKSIEAWQPALQEIENDESIQEVILSGGDPLMLVDATLGALIEQISTIAHVRRLRLHTRMPVVLPERVTEELVEQLQDSGKTPIVVVHANHANELDSSVACALAKLADAGVLLLNQAVLLAGVNDSLSAQTALCERLIELRVLPYYLHQLDRVSGAAHFETPIEFGSKLVAQLKARLPGYAVPRFVQEVPGAASKIELP